MWLNLAALQIPGPKKEDRDSAVTASKGAVMSLFIASGYSTIDRVSL
jgi:hypothetical protein